MLKKRDVEPFNTVQPEGGQSFSHDCLFISSSLEFKLLDEINIQKCIRDFLLVVCDSTICTERRRQ